MNTRLDKTFDAFAESLKWDIMYMSVRSEPAAQAWRLLENFRQELTGLLTKDADEVTALYKARFFYDESLMVEHDHELSLAYNPETDKVEIRRLHGPHAGELVMEEPPSWHTRASAAQAMTEHPEVYAVDVKGKKTVYGKITKAAREAVAEDIIKHHPQGDDKSGDLDQVRKAFLYWQEYEAGHDIHVKRIG